MTKLVQIAPGVLFSADVLHPTWGQSIVPGTVSTSRNSRRDNERRDIDVREVSRDVVTSEQIELL